MDDKEKIKAAIAMLRKLKRMVGFFMKRDISELIERLESNERLTCPAKVADREL